jgi:3-oxoacyl-[acyl-carrier-protein] synthase II
VNRGEKDAIVVTGMGAETALGHGTERLFDGWMVGQSALQDRVGACRDFDPAAHLTRREVRNLDRCGQLSLVAAAEAVEMAGWLESPPCRPERIACLMGTALGGLTIFEKEFDVFRRDGAARLSPRAYTRGMANSSAAALSVKYGWRGESHAVVSGCSSGLQAIIAGARLLRFGVADAAVVGGVDAFLTDYFLAGYDAFGATSSSGHCRPYDRSRDGIIPAEGAGVVLLERSDSALARGATPVATLRGTGVTSDAHHIASPHPDGEGLIRALHEALSEAGFAAEDIDYVNTHGSGSVIGDRIEADAVRTVLGDASSGIPVSSTKSVIGHAQGAAGAVELIATALALRAAVAPATVGLQEPDEGMDLAFVTDGPRPLSDRTHKDALAGVSLSFGLGGHNAAAILTAIPANGSANSGSGGVR